MAGGGAEKGHLRLHLIFAICGKASGEDVEKERNTCPLRSPTCPCEAGRGPEAPLPSLFKQAQEGTGLQHSLSVLRTRRRRRVRTKKLTRNKQLRGRKPSWYPPRLREAPGLWHRAPGCLPAVFFVTSQLREPSAARAPSLKMSLLGKLQRWRLTS